MSIENCLNFRKIFNDIGNFMKFFYLIAIFLLFSCGAKQRLTVPEKKTKNSFQKEEKTRTSQKTFSFVEFDKDDLDFSVLEPKKVEEKDETEKIAVRKEVRGWRVQVIVLRDFDRAKQLEQELQLHFGEEHQVYVSFYSPNYRVRVGDFQSRHEAKKLEPLLKEMGYKDAWSVQDNIFIIEEE
jgi:cell division protein FtsN